LSHVFGKILQMDYEKYTGLLSKIIWRTATPAELKQVKDFETATPPTCPYCGIKTVAMSGERIVHDIQSCPKKR
jgi:hypothetical protein